jgi:uncharacterized protein (TIGR02646 family)
VKALTKEQLPAVLVEKGPALTAAFLASGGKTSPWSHPQIKEALIRETGGKCAYCEGDILAVSFGDVEHILPKSKFPQMVLTWANLTLACSRCNAEKGSKYEAESEFVNPYRDSIEDHLLFLGAVVHDVSDRGLYTVNELKLNDAHRVENRDQVLKNLESLMRRYENAPEGYAKGALLTLIQIQTQQGEYTAAIRSYLSLRKQKVALSS